jgi:hypothetical protein
VLWWPCPVSKSCSLHPFTVCDVLC